MKIIAVSGSETSQAPKQVNLIADCEIPSEIADRFCRRVREGIQYQVSINNNRIVINEFGWPIYSNVVELFEQWYEQIETQIAEEEAGKDKAHKVFVNQVAETLNLPIEW